MAKFSKKVMGKEVGDAKVYAPPHTMKGKAISAKGLTSKGMTGAQEMADMNISVDGISKTDGKGINKYGKIEMRGAGAATKGRMSSGKMG
jgi:hypothetical protein